MKAQNVKITKSETTSIQDKMSKDVRLKELNKTLKKHKHLSFAEREILRIICEVDYGIKIS